jgi:hypothetical protein
MIGVAKSGPWEREGGGGGKGEGKKEEARNATRRSDEVCILHVESDNRSGCRSS